MNATIVKAETPVYAQPNGQEVFRFDQGEVIKVLDIDNGWVKFAKSIQGKTRQGFVRQYLAEPIILWKGEVKVNTSLNVRSGPGTSNDVIASLKNGQKVLVLDEMDGEAVNGVHGWLEIMHASGDDGIAFIFKKYVNRTADADELATSVDLKSGGWDDDADHTAADAVDDWSDLTEAQPAPEKTAEEVEEEAKKEEEAKEEESLWSRVKSWF
ncbi:MAG: SH3 domain-containing protein [Bacteroidota bacterium]